MRINPEHQLRRRFARQAMHRHSNDFALALVDAEASLYRHHVILKNISDARLIVFWENDDRKASREILQRQQRHRIAALRRLDGAAGDNAGHAHKLVILHLRLAYELMQRHKALHNLLVFTERMVRHIKAEQLLFVLQQRLLGDFCPLRQPYLLHAKGLVIAEQSQLAVRPVSLTRSA